MAVQLWAAVLASAALRYSIVMTAHILYIVHTSYILYKHQMILSADIQENVMLQ